MFFECGVGRIDSKGRWQMVSGMMRLGADKSYKMKLSVARKKMIRYQKTPVELFVSRIRRDHGTMEVSLNAPNNVDAQPTFISASKLQPGDELTGTILEVRPYGCIVHVGANRKGLLHIKMIAQLNGKYIAKEQGIIDAGLVKGARIRVSVHSNERKRLLLDLPIDVKQSCGISSKERKSNTDIPNYNSHEEEATEIANYMTQDEAAEWASFAYQTPTTADNEEQGDDFDDDDEDRKIEDAFGLGTY